MKFCDITIAYNESSGGIRTYINEKRRYLLEQTAHEHLLIVPGERDHIERLGRSTTIYIDSPLLPGQNTYRFFLRPDKISALLSEHQPDLIELGSYYLAPWAAFNYRERLRQKGMDCVMGCYFHTDVAAAYVAAPLHGLARDWLSHWSELLEMLAEKLAELAESGAERYIEAVFERCDLAFAASPGQAERLHDYGVENVAIVPLGVDLQRFHPRWRSEAVRAQYGAHPDSLVLVYGGRLSTEKRVMTLLEAFQRLPATLKSVLWITGDGPLCEEILDKATQIPALQVLPYQHAPDDFARLLASADIYVTAGPHETFALSVIEAQACGLPVVGVNAGALSERVLDGLGYLGPVDDGQAMAENIVKAAANHTAIGLRARRHVEQHLGWDSTFQKLLEYYAASVSRLEKKLPSSVLNPQ